MTTLRRIVRRLRKRIRAWREARHIVIGPFRAPTEVPPLTADEQVVVDAFHKLYYESWNKGRAGSRQTISLSWLGYRTLKNPLDLWVYQEILVETRPDVIVECGTRHGGSALFLACILDILDHGRIVTVDIQPDKGRPRHPRIAYVDGSSTDPAVVERVRGIAAGKRTMVILDSDHSQTHVAGELAAYHDLVPVGMYLVVEDTDINGHPVEPDFGPGPMEALDAFLATTDRFEIDASRERFMLTHNPRGFLRRVR